MAQAQAQSTETVTVACKLPHGLELRVFDMIETQEPMFGGGYKPVKVARERAERAIIKGNAFPQEKGPSGPIIGGFALTHGVPKDLWDLWIKQNARLVAVQKGLIFAHLKADNTEAEAREKEEIKSGLERLDPAKPGKDLEPAQKD